MPSWIGPLAGRMAIYTVAITPLVASLAILYFAASAPSEQKSNNENQKQDD